MKDEGRTAILRRLSRLLLYCLTATRRPDVDVLAARLGVSKRTAYRDLEALESAGWRIPGTER